ncbi:hypothetical protein TSMEX_006734, partial [Taenia solium]|eukprot:TsM_001037700 transcript=TsM_001037700 gene=TsM_001037700
MAPLEIPYINESRPMVPFHQRIALPYVCGYRLRSQLCEFRIMASTCHRLILGRIPPVMGLHFSLLATVAAIMAWVIRTENGGLLNVLFRIVPPFTGHDPQFELITKVDEPVVDFFRQMLLLRPLPLPILQVIPESLGGG